MRWACQTGPLASLQRIAVEKQIPLYEENLPNIQQGWQGKQKGFSASALGKRVD
jgi:hypothetical protein